jgi:hypothetical protein
MVRGCELRRIEAGVTIERRIASREQQRILLSQRNLQRPGKAHDHRPARLRAAGFEAAQVTRRDLGLERHVELTDPSNTSPVAQQDAEVAVRSK